MMPEPSTSAPYVVHELPGAGTWGATLAEAWQRIERSGLSNRPWMFCELHNPWSRAATVVDSWTLLDICQSPALTEKIAELIGDDIVLFDSQFVPVCRPDRGETSGWASDADFFPLSGNAGIVARLPFGTDAGHRLEFNRDRPARVDYRPGQVLLHRGDDLYRHCERDAASYREYVVRYYSAAHFYERDPAHPKQVRLMERYPWVNYSTMPHWLVRGEDRAGNDFVTGFRTKPGRWSGARFAIQPAATD